jgi:transposase
MIQAPQGDWQINNLFWLKYAQKARLEPFFPTGHGKPRDDDRGVLGVIILINRVGSRRRDAPREYGSANSH